MHHDERIILSERHGVKMSVAGIGGEDDRYVYLVIFDGDALLEAKMRPEYDAVNLVGQLEPMGFRCELRPTGFHPMRLPHSDPRHECHPGNPECQEWVHRCRLYTASIRRHCTCGNKRLDEFYEVPNLDCENEHCNGRIQK